MRSRRSLRLSNRSLRRLRWSSRLALRSAMRSRKSPRLSKRSLRRSRRSSRLADRSACHPESPHGSVLYPQ
jgi:hypothetical protein